MCPPHAGQKGERPVMLLRGQPATRQRDARRAVLLVAGVLALAPKTSCIPVATPVPAAAVVRPDQGAVAPYAQRRTVPITGHGCNRSLFESCAGLNSGALAGQSCCTGSCEHNSSACYFCAAPAAGGPHCFNIDALSEVQCLASSGCDLHCPAGVLSPFSYFL